MRFRYFDASGEEVRVSSVDALKFRIDTGAVTPETLLYDAAVDQWAPAREHAIYRFLTEDEGLVEAEEASSPRLRPGEGNVVLTLEPETRDEGSDSTGEAPTSDDEVDSLPEPEPEVARVARGAHIQISAGDQRALRARTRLQRMGAAALAIAAVAAAVYFARGGADGGDAAFAASGGVTELGVPEIREPSSAEPSEPVDGPRPDLPAEPAGAGEVSAPLSADREELAAEVAAAATGDLELALMDLKLALDVPDRPPEIWLHGRYLAAADSFPEVRTYWQSVSAYVTSMQELEEDLYRGFVESRVLRMRLDTAAAADLSARSLERHHRTAEQRAATFESLNELTETALSLHDVLASRSAEIAYEPFDSRGLSRDPVVEAVADDPDLAEEIWTALDGIFSLLDELQGIGPVSTALLQEAVIVELRGDGGV